MSRKVLGMGEVDVGVPPVTPTVLAEVIDDPVPIAAVNRLKWQKYRKRKFMEP